MVWIKLFQCFKGNLDITEVEHPMITIHVSLPKKTDFAAGVSR